MSEQWTDERIIAEAEALVAHYGYDDSDPHRGMRQSVIQALRNVRNDMQVEIARLQTVVIERNETIDEMNRIAELAKDTHALTEALKQQQQIANEYRRLLGQSNAQNDALRQQLGDVLDVAIARGIKLGYEDADYHELYEVLAGTKWDEQGEQANERVSIAQ